MRAISDLSNVIVRSILLLILRSLGSHVSISISITITVSASVSVSVGGMSHVTRHTIFSKSIFKKQKEQILIIYHILKNESYILWLSLKLKR